MFTLRLTHQDSMNYDIINKRSQQVAGYLTYSLITEKWYMENRETKIYKKFNKLVDAVLEIIY